MRARNEMIAAVFLGAMSASGVVRTPHELPRPAIGVVRSSETFSTGHTSLHYDLRHISGISGYVESVKGGDVGFKDITPKIGMGSLQFITFMAAGSDKREDFFGVQSVITVLAVVKGADKAKGYVIIPDVEIYQFKNNKQAQISEKISGWGHLYSRGIKNEEYMCYSKPLGVKAGEFSGKLSIRVKLRDGVANLFFSQRIGSDTLSIDDVNIGSPGEFSYAKIISDPKERINIEGGYVGAEDNAAFIPSDKRFHEKLWMSDNGKAVNVVPVSLREDNTEEKAEGMMAVERSGKVIFTDGLGPQPTAVAIASLRKDMKIYNRTAGKKSKNF